MGKTEIVMTMDLVTLSRGELEKLKADVEKALVAAKDRERKEALVAAERAVAEYGFTLSEIAVGTANGKRGVATGVAKYRNPKDPEQTWTGKGRQPAWFKAALGEGVDPSDMEI
jgi:DNA-binding protein H-NS